MSVTKQRPTSALRHGAHERPARGGPPAAERAERRARRPALNPASDVRTWLIALGVIAVVLLAFIGMVALTALAGGDTFLS
ncbi:hypothetical protein [Blastococcus saxobsidens]|uniref:Uncharacterized protein n=1 Tax=Blastococcus saxobsidens TaxID=138336 RepID=A0A4Q7Y3U2_9ACTN|nr:hypothetical protein [Blastococcus saxobsidens]RZU30459.1 hypothetical protein BKA19_0075 [Blastococcus saxobsidens]